MPDARIFRVEAGSVAEEGGILPGDTLISVNGHKIHDIFDYKYYSADEEVLLKLKDSNGDIYTVEISKDIYEDIGIEFVNALLDQDRGCSNNCVFCFIDQMPKGMRETLYFKDDDTRLSFLTGNYVTLTNIGKRELSRLIEYKISPINVSVHTTNSKLRCHMLKNKKAGDIMEKLRLLSEGNIVVNAQIVLCPELNDGIELVNTLNDLYSLNSSIYSVSVVPVGITKHRDGLVDMRLFTLEESKEIIKICEDFQVKAKKCIGRSFVYAADEIYIKACIDIPRYELYDDFPQIENGVGMISSFEKEIDDYLSVNIKQIENKAVNRVVSIATGDAFYPFMKKIAKKISKILGSSINVYKIQNDFFGDTVTVAGLITGKDLVAQLKDKELGEKLLITKNMLRDGEDVFLDNITLGEAIEELGIPIIPVIDKGPDFINNLL